MHFKYIKDGFINKYEQSDIVEDYKTFLYKIEKLKSYLVKFNENSIMKNKMYLPNNVIEGGNY